MHVRAGGETRLRLAEVSIGAVHVGVPVQALLQAIPVPASRAILPRRQGALRGVVDHHGTLVPVVDLARWVDVGTATGDRGDAQRILILREHGRMLGLQVDAVGGLVDVRSDLITRLHHDEDPDEIFHTMVESPETGRILNLLDVSRLAVLAAAWNGFGGEGDMQAPPTSVEPPMGRGQARPYALLQVGRTRLGVPASGLAQTIAMPALQRLGGSVGSGYCLWRGRHLPVLDPAVVVPDSDDAAAPGLLAVLEHDGLALALPIQAALELRNVDGTASAASGGVTATVFDENGEAILLLDTAALFERCPEAALSRPEVDLTYGRIAPAESIHATNASAWIVFEADGPGATSIDAVERVEPLTPSLVASGRMTWRGAAIPVVDLRPDRTSAHGHVMVIRHQGRSAGYIVRRVDLLIPPGTGRLYRMVIGGHPVRFITVGEGTEQMSYRELRLETSGGGV